MKNGEWLILVDFGRPRIVRNVTQMAQDGAKLEPRWRQDGQVGLEMAVLTQLGMPSGAFVHVLGAIFTKMAEQRFGFILASWGVWLEALGVDFERSWPEVGLSWVILASSWEFWAACWHQDGRRCSKIANLSRKS